MCFIVFKKGLSISLSHSWVNPQAIRRIKALSLSCNSWQLQMLMCTAVACTASVQPPVQLLFLFFFSPFSNKVTLWNPTRHAPKTRCTLEIVITRWDTYWSPQGRRTAGLHREVRPQGQQPSDREGSGVLLKDVSAGWVLDRCRRVFETHFWFYKPVLIRQRAIKAAYYKLFTLLLRSFTVLTWASG